MNYNFFLFSKLHEIKNQSEMEYDILFEIVSREALSSAIFIDHSIVSLNCKQKNATAGDA